jgi:hypothetical protein
MFQQLRRVLAARSPNRTPPEEHGCYYQSHSDECHCSREEKCEYTVECCAEITPSRMRLCEGQNPRQKRKGYKDDATDYKAAKFSARKDCAPHSGALYSVR